MKIRKNLTKENKELKTRLAEAQELIAAIKSGDLKRHHDLLEERVKTRIRELFEAYKEIARAKRLSDIGVLATTVAHELRNPLAAIGVAAYNIKRKAKNPHIEKHIVNIDKKVFESNQIINNLLFYSRLKPPHYERINIFDILQETIESIQDKRKKNVSIIRNINPLKPVCIEADPLQIKEVFNNILNNAYDAVTSDKGEIKITTEDEVKFVKIIVKDNGYGIDKDSLDRIFDPFFTTKAKGTGLGLSVCQQIVNFHDGSIDITSENRQGTAVIINLPKKEKKYKYRLTKD